MAQNTWFEIDRIAAAQQDGPPGIRRGNMQTGKDYCG